MSVFPFYCALRKYLKLNLSVVTAIKYRWSFWIICLISCLQCVRNANADSYESGYLTMSGPMPSSSQALQQSNVRQLSHFIVHCVIA